MPGAGEVHRRRSALRRRTALGRALWGLVFPVPGGASGRRRTLGAASGSAATSGRIGCKGGSDEPIGLRAHLLVLRRRLVIPAEEMEETVGNEHRDLA